MGKLTKKAVDGLSCDSVAKFLWDDVLSGFGVKALPSGAKKYVVKCRINGGGRTALQRWITLGAHGQLTCDQARVMAQQVLAAVARGEDPQAEKFKRRKAPVLNDAWERFEAEYLGQRKPQTRREYASQWREILKPKFANVAVSDISRSHIESLHKSLRATPYRANRILALCSRLLTLTEAWEWRPQGSNPCRYIERFNELSRSRYLSPSELRLLGTALNELADTAVISASAANAIRMLLLTGARLNEVLTARWAWVDWERKMIALPDSKSGAKPVFLSEAAVSVLISQKTGETVVKSDFIFPGRSTDTPLVNLRKPWLRVCKLANLSGVRLHDLRHTAASLAVGEGASLPVIGRLLGHTQAQTTLRYAHVDTDPALGAANQIGRILEKSFKRF